MELNMCRPYRYLKIIRKWKNNIILKAITMINPVMGWFEVTQYGDQKVATITNLLKSTWLTRYTWTWKITHNLLKKLDNEFQKHLQNRNME